MPGAMIVMLLSLPFYAQIKDYPHLRKSTDGKEVKMLKKPFDSSSIKKQDQPEQRPETASISATPKAEAFSSMPAGINATGNQLPYFNSLKSQENFEEFSVIDCNDDQKTWGFTSNYGTCYTNSTSRAADDWLVSPAFRLEQGKLYNFNIKARCGIGSYPEKFEVMAATANDAESLSKGAIVIQPTDVTSEDFKSFNNPLVSVPVTGDYYIGIHCISKSNQFVLAVADFMIEDGAEITAPGSVTDFTVTPLDGSLRAKIAFNAPTKTIGGEALSANDIQKIEITRDGVAIYSFDKPQPGAALNYTDAAADLTIGNHQYQALTYGASGLGGKSEIAEVFLSKNFTIPAYFNLADNNIFDAFKVIDLNSDGTTWSNIPGQGAVYYNGTSNANDYLISTGLELQAGKKYKVTVTARSYHELYPEKFRVMAGTGNTAFGLSIPVIPATEVSDVKFTEFSGDFTAQTTGVYYVGLVVMSDANAWLLTVKDITIEQYADDNTPAAPTMSVTPDASGVLKATVNVKAPTKTNTGANIQGKINKIDLYRDGDLAYTWTNVDPGATLTITDTPSKDGNHFYFALPYNDNGQGERSDKVTAFVGEDEPADLENVKVSAETATSFTMNWDTVKGATGNYINTADVTYDVVSLKVEWLWGMYPYFVEDQVMATVKGDTKATINYEVDKGEQDYKYFGVKATVKGKESDPTMSYARVYVGAPYELPIEETMANGYLYNIWFQGASTNLGGSSDGSGDRFALALNSSSEENPVATLESGKVNLNNSSNAMLIFDAKRGTSSTDKITVYNISPAGATTDIATVTLGNQYQTYKVKLTDNLKYERWNRLGLRVGFDAPETTVLIDNIRIVSPLDNDLQLSVEMPETVKVGAKASIKAKVRNTGENQASGYTLTVTADNKTILEETVAEALDCYNEKVFNIDLPTTIFHSDKDINVAASLAYTADGNKDDNEFSGTIFVEGTEAEAPGNVAATDLGDGDVKVEWTEPATYSETFVEDVESYTDFDTGGLNKDVHTGKIGEWTVYDGNQGLSGYNIENVTIPNLAKNNAWIVMNPSSSKNSQDLSPYYAPHSGKKFFLSSCVSQPENNPDATDHWLISPELSGMSQTVSFVARELTTEYGPEKIEVLYSTTTTDPANFVSVGTANVDQDDWMEFSYNLPEGTKYFALRHVSRDIFIVFVDDITFSVDGGELVKYNLYLDEALVASVDKAGEMITLDTRAIDNLKDGLSHTINKVQTGTHLIAVTALYANGKESSPNVDGAYTTIATENAGVIQTLIEGKPVDIYTLDGKLVRKNATSLDGLKGIYVIGGKKINIP